MLNILNYSSGSALPSESIYFKNRLNCAIKITTILVSGIMVDLLATVWPISQEKNSKHHDHRYQQSWTLEMFGILHSCFFLFSLANEAAEHKSNVTYYVPLILSPCHRQRRHILFEQYNMKISMLLF